MFVEKTSRMTSRGLSRRLYEALEKRSNAMDRVQRSGSEEQECAADPFVSVKKKCVESSRG